MIGAQYKRLTSKIFNTAPHSQLLLDISAERGTMIVYDGPDVMYAYICIYPSNA